MPFSRSPYTGFPFDAESSSGDFPFDRDSNLQSTLQNIAQRHPELVEHLTNFNKPSRTKNTPTGESNYNKPKDPSVDESNKAKNPSEGEFYFGKAKNPLADEFNYFNKAKNSPADEFDAKFRTKFDDNDDVDLDQYLKRFYNHPSSSKRDPEEKEASSTLHQSKTADLGQKQDPIDEKNQRSMSEPPGDTKKRFTSSINIPVRGMAQNPDAKPTERIIPIQIEGRDEPIVPRNAGAPQGQARSGPEQIFGQRPEVFSQFVRPSDGFSRRGFPEDHFARQNLPEDHFPRQNLPEEHPSRQTAHPQHSAPSPAAAPKPPQQEEPKAQPPKPATPIDQIQNIQKDVSKLMEQVEQFKGHLKDKQYAYLDEMLTRNLLKLDNIDTQGQENIRASRKEAIRCIQQAISLLESKASQNVEQEKMETDLNGEEKTEGVAGAQETRAVLVTEVKTEDGGVEMLNSDVMKDRSEAVKENEALGENEEKKEQ